MFVRFLKTAISFGISDIIIGEWGDLSQGSNERYIQILKMCLRLDITNLFWEVDPHYTRLSYLEFVA